VASLAGFVVDDDDPRCRLQVAGERFQISGPIFDVMEHVVEERHVDVFGRQTRIAELTEDCLDIGDLLLTRPAVDALEEPLVDFDRGGMERFMLRFAS
jgi:hypothetical protein